jgi:hypothetical protein
MMHWRIKLIVGLMLFAPFLTVGAKAMSIDVFGYLNNDDEATFVTLLVQGAADMLKAKGQADQAARVIALFNDSGPHGGVAQLALNLKMMHAVNVRSGITARSGAPVYQVEDAMAKTLMDAGITVSSKYLLSIGADFAPLGPPRSHITGQ